MSSLRYVSIAILAVIICMNIPINPVSADEIPIVSRGEQFNISATLLSNGTYGEPIPNQVVFFYDQTMDSLMASTKTDNNGIASLDYTFSMNHPLGNTLVNITFRGNTTLALAPTCQWFMLILTSQSNIQIHVSETELAPHDNLEFSLQLTDDINNPIDFANISITCDGSSILDDITNETGHLSVSIPLNPLDFSLGHHIIEVRYEGDSVQFYRGTSSSFEININRISTSIDLITAKDNPIMLTETWSVTLQVMSEKDQIAMDQCFVYIDGIYFDSTTINQEGYINYTLPINQSFSIGEYTITFEYSGNNRYSDSHIDLVLSIGTSLNLNITPLFSAEIGQDVPLEIIVQDVYLRPLSNGTIEIRDTSTNQSITETLSGKTDTIIQFPILGERGPRILHITVLYENLLSNNTLFLNLDIWTRPKIKVILSNIKGFASPLQTLIFDIRLEDYRGFLNDKNLLFHVSNANYNSSVITGSEGIGRIEITSPLSEGSYLLYIYYEGNLTDFELPCNEKLPFIVSQTIPLEVMFQDYEIIAPLSSILVRLQLQALNGSYIEGVFLEYNWISTEGNTLSGSDGIIELYLAIPSTSGIHSLRFEVEPSRGLQACSGVIYIITTSEDANASEGVGFYGLILGFTSSIGLSMATVVRRRLIIG